MMRLPFLSLVAVVIVVLWTLHIPTVDAVVAAAKFSRIPITLTASAQAKIRGLHLPITCPTSTTSDDKDLLYVPNTIMVTIVPSTELIVMTSPANLVRLAMDDTTSTKNVLRLEWNPNDVTTGNNVTVDGSLPNLGSVGIVVQIPDAQFQSFASCCATKTQILEGFTQLAELSLDGASSTHAILGPNSIPPTVNVSSFATATIQSKEGFDSVVLSSNALVEMRGNIWNQLQVSSESTQLTLDGSIGINATTATLQRGASMIAIEEVCNQVELQDDATCRVVPNPPTIEPILGMSLTLEDDEKRTTCIPWIKEVDENASATSSSNPEVSKNVPSSEGDPSSTVSGLPGLRTWTMILNCAMILSFGFVVIH